MPVFAGVIGAVGDLAGGDIAATIAGDTAIAGGADAFAGATDVGYIPPDVGGSAFSGVPSWLTPGNAAPFFSAGANYAGQQATNATQIQLAQQAQAFEERMSSTAWQRSTKDMEAAGLNPMLAYSKGGASTPGGIMPTISNPVAAGTAGYASAAAAENARASNALIDAQTDETRAKAVQHLSSAGQLDAARDNTRLQMQKFDVEYQNLEKALELQEARKRGTITDYLYKQRMWDLGFPESEIGVALARARELNAKADLYQLDKPRALVYADSYEHGILRYEPAINVGIGGVKAISSAAGAASRFRE